MNERIKELIKQATECYSNGQERTFDKEKFAQLIVRECAKLNKKQYYELLGVIADTEENDGFDDICLETVKRVAQYLASNALIDHFGEKQ